MSVGLVALSQSQSAVLALGQAHGWEVVRCEQTVEPHGWDRDADPLPHVHVVFNRRVEEGDVVYIDYIDFHWVNGHFYDATAVGHTLPDDVDEEFGYGIPRENLYYSNWMTRITPAKNLLVEGLR